MIDKKHPIWGFKTKIEEMDMPSIFSYSSKRHEIAVPPEMEVTYATIIPGVLNALWELIQEENIGIGTRTSATGETIYVEYRNGDTVHLVSFDPENKALRGSTYDKNTEIVKPYRFGRECDGTAVFLALYQAVLGVEPEAQKAYDRLIIDKDYNQAPLLCYLFYCALTNQSGRAEKDIVNLEEEKLHKIPKVSISKGHVGPSAGKVHVGSFEVLKVGGKSKPSANKKKRAEEEKALFERARSLPFVRTWDDFSPIEKAMVKTEVPANHVVSDQEIFLLNEITETFEDPYSSIKTLMFLGPSSSGKSHMAEILATRFGRPLSAPQTCTPNLDETGLLGTVLPVIDSGAQRDSLSREDNDLLDALYESSEEQLQEVVSKALSLPDIDSILYDPEGSYEALTGSAKTGVDSQTVVKMVEAKIANRLKKLALSLPASSSEVTYKYYKSPLVRAIEHGWFIEIQEFNVVKEAALFASLNNVFDKDANGILETPYGQVQRHPDFRAVYTANPDYAGCRDAHQSVIARCDMVMSIDNPAKEVMMNRIEKRMPFKDKDLLNEVVSAYMAASEKATELSCSGEATMRELYRFANAILRGTDPLLALENYVVNAITRDPDDKAEIMEAAQIGTLIA